MCKLSLWPFLKRYHPERVLQDDYKLLDKVFALARVYVFSLQLQHKQVLSLETKGEEKGEEKSMMILW